MITMNHVAISVTNFEKAMEFYRNAFGLELAGPIVPFSGAYFEQIMSVEKPEGRIGFMSNGSVQVELFEFTSPTPAPKHPNYPVSDHGITHFCVTVDDIDAEYERLKGMGVRFHCPVLTYASGTRATYARDLDGNVFELVEAKKKS